MVPEFLKKLDIGQLKLAAVAVLIIVIFVIYKWRKGKKEKVQPKKKAQSKSTSQTKKKSSKARAKPKDDDDDENGEEDESMSSKNDEIDENLRGDAEELYNLAHEGLAKGMQKNDFKTLVGDLADDYTFIQLKQLYNDRERRNMNPLTTIHVTDYIQILQNEGKE